ncbi:hypothetical protein HDC90_003435 [Pedobacter sp. AK013]|uniref:hypothetical protein n=1 Tax=Pedobacter sp. AK013 TaxID=2723071 RepID=UPI001611A428|nr:hypothetical protein [Pedobacter sp. AK013]MBB6238788.1 hypothetical protein [Pedobacter sp. AK013]
MSSEKYYIFESAKAPQEIGPEFPQIQMLKSNYDMESEKSIFSFLQNSSTKISKIKPDLNAFILQKESLPTDLISNAITAAHGFLVSLKLKRVLEGFKLPLHEFFEAHVIHNNVHLNDYFYLHIISDLTEYVDYINSIFYYHKRFSSEKHYIQVKSKQDYNLIKKKIRIEFPNTYIKISAEKIVINSPIDNYLDFFQIGGFDFNFYTSERLMEVIKASRLSGINLSKSNLSVFSP